MIHLISCSAETAKNLKEKYPHAAMEDIPQNPKLTPHDALQMMRSELGEMRQYDAPLTPAQFAYHVHNLEEALGENDV